jgi:TetR/AcrR family acrAB operon transcriptional repressor
MARRTKEEALETRKRILDTAERVFEKKGVSRTTLEDIANAAGVTRGAIYWHFKNKSELFSAMFDRVRLPMDALLDKGTDDHVDPIGRLKHLSVLMLKDVASKRQDQRVLNILYHKSEMTKELKPTVSRYRKIGRKGSVGAHVAAILKNAVEAEQVPRTLDLERAGILYEALLTGLFSNWTLDPKSFDLNRHAEGFVDAYIDMLRFSPALSTGG